MTGTCIARRVRRPVKFCTDRARRFLAEPR